MNPIKSVPFIVLGLLSISNPAWGLQITMTPPPLLSLDGQEIETGTFNVTSATGFRINDDQLETVDLLTDGPVSIDAVIGSPKAQNLFQVDNNIQAIQYSGFFDADNEAMSNRPYHLTVGAFNGNDNPDWTVFLPQNPGESAFQLTNLGTSTTIFTNDEPMLFASQELAAAAAKQIVVELTNQNNPDVDPIWVGYNELSSVQFKPHGTGAAAVPEPFTILGSITALGVGTALKKKHSKRVPESNSKV